jgi:hypothetical protein
MSEQERLKFVESRDGIEGAKAFAKRTMQIYRSCVLRSRKRGYKNPHHASIPEYRESFIRSYLEFKHYLLKENNHVHQTDNRGIC